MRVRITRDALEDLREIASYIAQDSPRASKRVRKQLFDAARALGQFPYAYPDTGLLDVRKRAEGSYVILYRVRQEVEVLRVIHGARHWVKILWSLA